MRGLTVKYLAQDRRTGHFLYRRRVPKALQGTVTGGEFVRVLGKTQSEALTRYGAVHGHLEHLLALAKHGVEGLSPAALQEALKAKLQQWGRTRTHPAGRPKRERCGKPLRTSFLPRMRIVRQGDTLASPMPLM